MGKTERRKKRRRRKLNLVLALCVAFSESEKSARVSAFGQRLARVLRVSRRRRIGCKDLPWKWMWMWRKCGPRERVVH